MPNENSIEFENRDEDQPDHVDVETLHDAVVTATDWTTETILTQMERGNIQLSPRFQRRDAWDLTRKSRFIESLFLGLPVPQIVLAEQKGQRGRFVVLDGKQRLLSLLQFSGRGEGQNNGFSLRGLDVRDDLSGTDYEQLAEDPAYSSDLDAFHNHTVRTVVIRNWPSNDFLYLVFVRLNTGSVQLSPQELRQALHPGDFVDFIDDKACDSDALRRLLRKTEPDFRMRDTELLLRHVAFKRFLNVYSGNLKQFLDNTCKDLNDQWEVVSDSVSEDVGNFEAATNLCFEVFGERNVGRRWVNNNFQGQFNRALFDVLSYFFASPEIRDAVTGNHEQILAAFKVIFTSEDFVTSITTTTKSIGATYTRFHQWGIALHGVLGDCVPIPQLNGNNRIVFPVDAEG
jgi:hypothetical protein